MRKSKPVGATLPEALDSLQLLDEIRRMQQHLALVPMADSEIRRIGRSMISSALPEHSLDRMASGRVEPRTAKHQSSHGIGGRKILGDRVWLTVSDCSIDSDRTGKICSGVCDVSIVARFQTDSCVRFSVDSKNGTTQWRAGSLSVSQAARQASPSASEYERLPPYM